MKQMFCGICRYHIRHGKNLMLLRIDGAVKQIPVCKRCCQNTIELISKKHSMHKIEVTIPGCEFDNINKILEGYVYDDVRMGSK